MTASRYLFALALVPALLLGSMRPSADAGAPLSGEARLELSALKAEARSMAVHLDGP